LIGLIRNFVLGIAAALTTAAAQPPELRGEPIVVGKSYALPSAVYGTDQEINIYVPEAEWAEKPLPVLYLIDGGLEQDFLHIAGLSQLTLVNGERQPMIVVGIKTTDRYRQLLQKPKDRRYRRAFPEHGGGMNDFIRYLRDEVIPFVESQHPPGRRVLMGESLAGHFVLDVLLRQPELFHDYVAVSPSLWWDDRRLAAEAPDLLEEWDAEVRRLYLTMADEGGTMQLGLDEVLAALQSSQPAELLWTYVDRRDEDTHATIYHHAARDALRWLFALSHEQSETAPWYLRLGGQPPAN
jgi:predicted alpha/beta superfamily hydrolase